MSKLWIFGDSFAMPQAKDSTANPWTLQLAKRLNVESSMNFALPGVGNDYIFYRLSEHINQTEEGDYIIIQTTNRSRQWFFEDPVLSNYAIRDIAKYITKDQDQALKEYITHLQNDTIDEMRFVQFSLALERISQLAEHARILILPGFHNAFGVNGTLIQICDEEFVNLDAIPPYYEANDGKDPRINHMSLVNHAILTDKVFDFFTNGTSINLTSDFEKNFLE